MRTQIIAEVTSNHAGNPDLVLEFVRAGAKAGVDYIKFQSWKADHLRDGKKDPQWEWFNKAEFTDELHHLAIKEARKLGIKFLTTVFHEDRIPFLKSLGLTEIKIGSAESPNTELVKKARENFEHVIVSTGMSDLKEIETWIPILKQGKFTIMHCVSLYPVTESQLQLETMNVLRKFTPRVGYSDSFPGTEACKFAIAMGAVMIEKHFCLEARPKAGNDGSGGAALASQAYFGPKGRAMPWDATPAEMADLVQYAKRREEFAGTGEKVITDELRKSRQFFYGRYKASV